MLVAVGDSARGRPRGAQLALTALAFAGVALVISHGDPSRLGGAERPRWELLVLGGVFGWLAYTLGARRFPDFSPLRYTALSADAGHAVDRRHHRRS